ncbi:cytosine deaminase [Schnuerera sp.]|uniref:cytosine deaminase n=1 Tax=Schnuerera sp. TaxID=2794844 RepID=UPI002BBC7DE2|nr:cytosine deaminase [Schnuerera sp.]HSH36582.1 cytosine deaminase [Schnuerera sp.]
MELIVRNAKLRDKKYLVDIGIDKGKIIKINKTIQNKGLKEIDAKGNLVTPPFVESHVHLDSALSAGIPRYNESGTLIEGIEIWGERKKDLTKEDIKENAKETIKWLITNGVLKIRTHTDSTEPSLMTLEALLEIKEEMREYVDIQIVAFPQDGLFSINNMDKLMVESIRMGADVIGGIPQIELTREDGIKSIEYIFNLANKYNKLIDIHTDETGDDQSRFTEVIAKYTILNGMEGLVTASHATAMHNYQNDYASKLISILKRANINIVTNPTSNAILQNRLDGYPRKRGHTRVDQLINSGVNVSIGNDNIMDPFGPLGKGNMLQTAHILLHTAHLSGNQQILQLFDMISVNGAKTIHADDYGINVGEQADLIILDAKDEKEAIRLISECLYVIRKGKVISQTKPAERKLELGGKIFDIDFKLP